MRLGYREALAYLAGFATRAELRAHLIRNTRRYAKRQATWFRSEPDVVRIPLAADHGAEEALMRVGAEAAVLAGWK